MNGNLRGKLELCPKVINYLSLNRGLAIFSLIEFLHNNRVKENQADRQAVGVMKCLLVSFQTEVPI